ncbi:acylneuraminate cytidylyltransferase family protein [Akkermansiaceae bacterium]|nr:acylneuraminate cytidylyltransferase family protein [Akkermansiaceae bacterium]MDB4480700.1 acylneuraminate cytidylyltransferase family protein [Akkermansiaceae bacterium]
MRVLGLINARQGSTGIPGKNIKPLRGKPLIAYAIEAGLAARRIDRVVVSTDSAEIAEVAIASGADVPFLRPGKLAQYDSPQIDAIRHALMTLEEEGDAYDVVAILQPTCPLRRAEDIDRALELMEAGAADTVITVTDVAGWHPLTMYTETEVETLRPLIDANPAGVMRQTFPKVWWRNGAVYAIKSSVILEQNSLYGEKVMGSPMPMNRSSNIDEPNDWIMTEIMMDYLVKADSD